MLVIPAIDLSEGTCVRLRQGRKGDLTRYGDDPVAFARQWEDQGAQLLHLVDLDGAIDDKTANFRVICAIVEALTIPVELGGGMRSFESVQRALEAGVRRAILGTLAVREPETVARLADTFGGDRIVVGVDAVNGRVATHGWTEVTDITDVDMAARVESWGVQTIIFTDIGRDGMLSGPNIPALQRMLDATDLNIVASGGIAQLQDIRALAALQHPRLEGVITGKALYEQQFTLPEAIAAAAG